MNTMTRSLFLSAAVLVGLCVLGAQTKPNCTGAVELFRSKCSMCHGQDGKGYAAIHTPDFTSSKWQAAHKDAELIDAVSNGKKNDGTMPPFKDKLTADQIRELVVCAVRGFAPKHLQQKGGK